MDFDLLDGIDANKTDPCTLQFLAAPICLLYKNLANKIVPIAIQVGCLPCSFPRQLWGSQGLGRSSLGVSTLTSRRRRPLSSHLLRRVLNAETLPDGPGKQDLRASWQLWGGLATRSRKGSLPKVHSTGCWQGQLLC